MITAQRHLRSTVRRAGAVAATMLMSSLATFVVLSLAPGDRARLVANARHGGEGAADAAIVTSIRSELGLDRPLLLQFADWLGRALRLDLGSSFIDRQPVADIAARAFGDTILLALVALALGLAVALALAWLAATRPETVADRAIVAVSSIGAAMPSFWTGLLLILVFSVGLGWLPAYGHGSFAHLVLPALTLALWVIAARTRLFRTFLREAMSAPYLDALRLRGIGESELLLRHVFRHVIVAALPVLLLDLAILVEGAVIVETVFARPGVGFTLLKALQARDFPVVQCLVVAAAAIYAVCNALADVLAQALDPRLAGEDGRA
jgi:peptide/nickel transport system permease protein